MVKKQPELQKGDKFLRLNGIWIPVADQNSERVPVNIGNRDRAIEGKYILNRTKLKQQYNFRTCPMTMDKACALENIIQGRGQSYPYKTDFKSCKGTDALFPSVLLGQYVDQEQTGKFGGGALAPNFAVNVSDIQDTSGTAAGWFDNSGNASATDDFTEAYIGAGCVQLSFGAAYAGGQIEEQIDATSLNNTEYTVSFFAKLDGIDQAGKRFGIQVRDNTSTLLIAQDQVIANPYDWTRFEFTFTTNATGEPLFLQFEANVSDNSNPFSTTGDILVDAIMLEENRTTASTFTLGTGAGGTHNIDTDIDCSDNAFTLSFWAKRRSGFTVDGQIFNIIGDTTVENPLTQLFFNVSTTTAQIQINVGGVLESKNIISMFQDDDDHLVTLVYRERPCYDQEPVEVYYDGGLVLSWDPGETHDFSVDSIDRTQWTGDNAMQMNDLQVYDYAVDHQIIHDWYYSDKPQGCMPTLTADGLFDKRCEVEVIGEVTNAEYVSAVIDGEFHNNAIALTFILHEV